MRLKYEPSSEQGSCNYDQTVFMPPGEKIPGAGLTVFGSHYAEGFGGKGANQVLSLISHILR